MISDTERREVARRLRGLRLNPWNDAACEIVQCVGIACCNSECHGSDETPECTMVLAHRLADLIEPDTTTDTTKSAPDTTKCDRDALLELADELDSMERVTSHNEVRVSDEVLVSITRRIREALGVADG